MLPRAERITEFVGILYAALSVGGREPAGEHFIVVFGFYGRRGYVVIFGVNHVRRSVRALALFAVFELRRIRLRRPAGVKNEVGTAAEIFFGVLFAVYARRACGVIPTCEVITFAGGGRQVHRIADSLISNVDFLALHCVESEFISIDGIRRGFVVRAVGGCELNRKNVVARLSKRYGIFVRRGLIRLTVYGNFVFGRTDDVIPRKHAAVVFKRFVKRVITHIERVAPKRFRSLEFSFYGYGEILALGVFTDQFADLFAESESRVGGLVFVAADTNDVTGSVFCGIPSQVVAVHREIRGRNGRGFVKGKFGSLGFVIAVGLADDLYFEFAGIAFKAEFRIVADVEFLVADADDVFGSLADGIPGKQAVFRVISEVFYLCKRSVERIGRNRRRFARRHSLDREDDTALFHRAVHEVEVGGKTVVDFGMIMSRIAAIYGNKVFFRTGYGVEHEYGVPDDTETRCAQKRVVKIISFDFLAVAFERYFVISRGFGRKVVSVGVARGRADGFGRFKSVRSFDGYRGGFGYARPLRTVDVDAQKHGVFTLGGPQREKRRVGGESIIGGIFRGKFRSVVIRTHPPAVENVTVSYGVGDVIEFPAHGRSRRKRLAVVTEVEFNLEFGGCGIVRSPQSVKFRVFGYGVGFKRERHSAAIGGRIPCNEFIAGFFGVCGFGESLAVKYGFRGDLRAAVRLERNLIILLSEKSERRAVVSNAYGSVFKRACRLAVFVFIEVEGKNAVFERISTRRVFTAISKGEIFPAAERQQVFAELVFEVISTRLGAFFQRLFSRVLLTTDKRRRKSDGACG